MKLFPLYRCPIRLLLPGVGIVLLALFVGCATAPRPELPPLPTDLPSRVELSEVPFYSQQERQCGPASLAMALEWSGVAVDFKTVSDQVFTPGRDGTLPPDMIGGARRNDRIAYPVNSLPALLREVSAGHPVIVLQKLQRLLSSDWHYAVVIGYDLEKKELLLRSGYQHRLAMDFHDFESTWQAWNRWGLVTLAPGTLPADSREAIYVKAVLGLEQTGHWASAEASYASALTRWPESLTAWMGLGNSRYRQGNLPGAVTAFQSAVQFAPQAGEAYNNLAHVLSELGRREEALTAARQAVAAGGPHVETFRTTLNEIQGR